MKRLSRLCALAHIKPAIILPTVTVISLIILAILWYTGPNTEGASGEAWSAPQEIWTIANPLGGTLNRVPEITVDPSHTAMLQELFNEAVSAAANARLTRRDYRQVNKEIRNAVADALEEFLVNHPSSAWVPSLRCNLGMYYRSSGDQTLALEHWEAIWSSWNESQHPITKKIADTSFVHWTSLLASLGRVEELTVLLEATRSRDFGKGQIRLLMNQTLEGYRQMVADPASSFRCGSLALASVAKQIGFPDQVTVKFFKANSPDTGFSVLQLLALANSENVRLSAVLRDRGAEIVVPSIVHWKQDHYAAVLEKRGTEYLVVDPTFRLRRWINIKTLESESSGVFIIPSEQNTATGYRLLADSESASIYGRGNPNHLPDWSDSSCPDCEECPAGSGGPNGASGHGASGSGGCGTCNLVASKAAGMAQWRVSEPYLNLWLHDEPWSYQPSRGERIAPQFASKQRNLVTSAGIQEATLGAVWNMNYRSSLHSNWEAWGEGTAFEVEIALPAGGVAYFYFDGINHSATTPNNNYHLTYSYDAVSDSVTNYTVLQGNGRQLVYDIGIPNGLGDKYAYVLSRIVSADGSETALQYDTSVPDQALLIRLIDPDNKTNTITYVNGEPWIETILSAQGQTSYLTYNVDFYGDPVLTSITDTVGITSEFESDYLGNITNLTTPYGITSFDFTDINDPNTFELQRRITVTHPDTSQECFVWYTMASEPDESFTGSEVPSGTPIETLENEKLRHRNTWYWNRQQYPTLSPTFKASGAYSDLTSSDKLKGRWRHWLQRAYGDPDHFQVGGLSLERLPSPDGVTQGQKTWYDYADKPGGDPTFIGAQVLPAVVARVMPDGSTWYESHKRDQYGHTTNKVEKWEEGGVTLYRTNRYIYAANGIDLLEHWHTHDSGEVREAAYGYNSNHQPLTITNAVGEVTTNTYSGNKLSTTGTPAGLLTTYTYNSASGLLETVVDSAGGTPIRTNTYTWEYGLVKTHTDERGLTITNSWDELERLAYSFFPDGSYIQNVYYLFPGQSFTGGNGTNILDVTASRDQLGNWTYFEYTPLRQKSKVTNPLNIVTKYEYCSCGGPEYIKQAFGTSLELTTQQLFDYQGRLTNVIKPGGVSLTNQYDSIGRLTNKMDALGSTTNWFDNLGRLVTVSNIFGQVQKTIYEKDDMVRTNIDANGVSTMLVHDDLHRIHSQILVGGGTNSWGYTANLSGPTSHTNELGKVTQYAYNSLGWKTNEVFVDMATNSYTYNTAGDLRTLSDGKTQVTRWGYDTFGRVTSKTNAANAEILRYAYHLNGALSNRWSSAKGNTIYGYDAAGNLTNVNYAASTDLRYKYDALNRVTNMVDAAGTTTNYYDLANRFMIEDGPFASDTVTNHWNTAGFVESVSVQQPSSYYQIGYNYDAARRLKTVSGTAGNFTNFYHAGLNSVTTPSKLLQQMRLPNSAFITNIYDGLARLSDTTLRQSSGAALNRHAYLYNDGHQRTKQTRSDGGYVDYLYDDAGQLFSAKTYDLANAEITAERRGYKYDPAWNLNTRTNNAVTTVFAVNNKNELTTVGGTSHTYDANGNLTGVAPYKVLTYDDENQLKTATDSSGNSRSEFIYDGRGRLRTQSFYALSGGVWNFQSQIKYIYAGMLVLQERDYSNVPTVSYTRGADLSGTLEGAGGIGGLLARSSGYSSGSWFTHNFYHADGNGNITAMLNSGQFPVASYKYDPYGNLLSSSGTLASANLYRFSSKMWCATTAIYYYGYRFYDPNLQRWLTLDPISELGFRNITEPWVLSKRNEANRYTFLNNSSIAIVDPHGLVNWGPFGGECCNSTSAGTEWAVVGGGIVSGPGYWVPLKPGECTSTWQDCDAVTCKGALYKVPSLGGHANCTEGPDCPLAEENRWTPGSLGEPPGHFVGGGNEPPPGYVWSE